ncbi:MAG: spore germination protein [Defluviitaleaceae bacterium]|nr:spore germination protein [Defluviitaleaceae bacterium]
MFSANNKISLRQYQVLLIIDIFGTSAIFLPRRAAALAGQDGWIALLIAGVVMAAVAFLMASAVRACPAESFVGLLSKLLSRPVAVILALLLVLRLWADTALELHIFGEITNRTLLHGTPVFVVCGVMILVGAYAASKGYETRARIGQIIFPVIFAPMILLFIFAGIRADWSNLKPVLDTPPGQLAEGAFKLGSSFTGLEFVLLAFPFINRRKEMPGATVKAVLAIGAFMVAVTMATLAAFGPADAARQVWPVIQLMDMVYFPGSFLERMDALVMSFWVLSVFAITNAGFFFSSVVLKDVFRRGNHLTYLLIGVPVVFAASFMPFDAATIYKVTDWAFMTFGIFFMVVLPVVIIVAAGIRRAVDSGKKVKTGAHTGTWTEK